MYSAIGFLVCLLAMLGAIREIFFTSIVALVAFYDCHLVFKKGVDLLPI
jgi:hypothetical protein